MITLLEDLPNELLLDIFEYISLRDLYYTFFKLNRRFNLIIGSLKNLFIIIYKNEQLLFEIFAKKITHLVVDNVHDIIDLRQFSNLRSLTIPRVTDNQLKQIRYEVMPYLIYLFISLPWITLSATEFANNIFSNRLPSLRHIALGQIKVSNFNVWSVAPSLYSVSIYSSEPIVIRKILTACPNLKRLEVKLGEPNQIHHLSIVPINHCLKHFILIDSNNLLSLEALDTIFLYIPNIKQLYFQGYCQGPFFQFAQILSNRLKYLTRFNCSILQSLNNYENDNLETIRQIHPCLTNIQCKINSHSNRLFTMDGLYKNFFE